jgi:FMN phosphatase YigB (HAD superfamily)
MVSAVIFDLGGTVVDRPNREEAVERFGEGFVSDMFERSEPDEVVSLPRTELVSMLERSGLMYVLSWTRRLATKPSPRPSRQCWPGSSRRG